jgi:hypothetical protein
VYATSGLSWGAFPGHTPDNIGSGVGVVSNTHLYGAIEKSVLRAPWQLPQGAPRMSASTRLRSRMIPDAHPDRTRAC